MELDPDTRETSGPSRLFGLAGDPLRRYPLRRLLETEAAVARLPLIVRHFNLRGLPSDPARRASQLLHTGRLFGLAGFHASGPLPTVLPWMMDQLSPGARRSGLVDTVLFIDDETFGFDCKSRALRDAMAGFLGFAPRRQVLLIGSGPDASAAASALADLGVERIYLLARDRDRAYAITRFLTQGSPVQARVLHSPDDLLDLRIDGVVNTLLSGPALQTDPRQPDRTVIPQEILSRRHWLVDTGITPFATPMIRHAQMLGCRTMTGPDLVPLRSQQLFQCITGHEASPLRLRAMVRASLDHPPDWPAAPEHAPIPRPGANRDTAPLPSDPPPDPSPEPPSDAADPPDTTGTTAPAPGDTPAGRDGDPDTGRSTGRSKRPPKGDRSAGPSASGKDGSANDPPAPRRPPKKPPDSTS